MRSGCNADSLDARVVTRASRPCEECQHGRDARATHERPRLAGTFVLAILLAGAVAHAAPLIDFGGETFREGTRTFEVEGAYIHPIRFSEDKFYNGNLALGYYFADDVSIGAEVSGYFVDQPTDDTAILGGGVLLRWHFLQAERYTLFVDGGFGVSIAEAAVPEGGTHFNYTPKGGVGATLRLRDDLHFIGGARFFHLSNANLHGRDQNPSQDGIQYYVGFVLTL
jgi:hypothetical protein